MEPTAGSIPGAMICPALIWRLSAAFAVRRFPSGSFLKGQAPTEFSIWQDRFGNGLVRFINPIPIIQRTDARSWRPADTVVARGGNSASGPEGLTSTSREAVDAGLGAASGHAYIGFRCVSDGLMVL